MPKARTQNLLASFLLSIRQLINPINHLRRGGILSRTFGYSLLHITRFHSLFLRLILSKIFYRLDERGKIFLQRLRVNGYVFIERNKLIAVEDLLSEAESILKAYSMEKKQPTDNKKSFLIPLLDQTTLPLASPLMQFALSREMVSLVSAYLGSLPILTYLNIWCSPVSVSTNKKSSQLWHLDHESLAQIKVFVYLRDVGEESGPTTIFSKADSRIIQEKIKYHLAGDEKHFDCDLAGFTKIPLLGKRGDMVLIDTGACIHRGAADVLEERSLFTIQYLPICAFSKNKFFNFKHQSFSARRYVEQKLLMR